MHRRDFLEAALPCATAVSAVGLLGTARAADPTPTDVVFFPGMIVREREPLNLEFPFSSLDRFVPPTERFYVRRHFARPKIDPATWRLRVEGHVEKPLELTLDD